MFSVTLVTRVRHINSWLIKIRLKSSNSNERSPHKPTNKKPPELPVYCCMSNCEKCVWITYAEELVEYYEKVDTKIVEEAIEKNVQDPSLKAYLRMELKTRGIIKK